VVRARAAVPQVSSSRASAARNDASRGVVRSSSSRRSLRGGAGSGVRLSHEAVRALLRLHDGDAPGALAAEPPAVARQATAAIRSLVVLLVPSNLKSLSFLESLGS